jgi:hypothetical protein
MAKVLCNGGPGYWIKKPYTAEEQAMIDSPDPNAWIKGYDRRYFLLGGEVWPRSKNKGVDLSNMTEIKFYGGAPHRPVNK